jgi:hypothetical protein
VCVTVRPCVTLSCVCVCVCVSKCQKKSKQLAKNNQNKHNAKNRALEFFIYTSPVVLQNCSATASKNCSAKAKQSKARTWLSKTFWSQNFKYPTPVGQITNFLKNFNKKHPFLKFILINTWPNKNDFKLIKKLFKIRNFFKFYFFKNITFLNSSKLSVLEYILSEGWLTSSE